MNSIFTGVLANGQRKMDDNIEIYEGDKVKATYYNDQIYEGIVVLDNGSFCIKITTENNKNHGNDYDIGSTPELNNFDSIVIIGNIYDEDKS